MTSGVETKAALPPTDETIPIEPLERFLAAALPNAVFGEPITSGPYTVITAREVMLGGGFGFGGGFAPAPQGAAEGSRQVVVGSRGGGSGGGSSGRPIAAIIIGPDGVKVQSIVDVTKLMLAAFATIGAVAAVGRRLSRPRMGR